VAALLLIIDMWSIAQSLLDRLPVAITFTMEKWRLELKLPLSRHSASNRHFLAGDSIFKTGNVQLIKFFRSSSFSQCSGGG